jgi:imidazolonepropionase-like amidohydrolase
MRTRRRIIKAGRALCGDQLEAVDDAWLDLRDGCIAGIHRSAPNADDAELIDCGDKIVMPGLIDPHVHLQLTPLADHESGRLAFERDRQMGWLPLRAAANARAALAAGITTVRDCASDMSLLAVRDQFAATLSGPRIIAAGLPITTTAGHCSWMGHVADTASEIRTAVRTLVTAGVDVVKIMASGGNMTAGSNPLLPQYTLEEIQTAVNEAHRLGRRVVAHALNSETIHRCVVAGVDCIDHCTWQRPDGSIQYDDAIARQLVTRGLHAGATGSGIARVLLEQGPAGEAQLRRTLYGHRRLRELGGVVGIHSDAGVRFTYFDRFDLSLKVLMAGLEIGALEALRTATSVAAQIVGLAEIGTIEAGKRADLLVLGADPRASIDNIRDVVAVFRDGVPVVEHGRVAA